MGAAAVRQRSSGTDLYHWPLPPGAEEHSLIGWACCVDTGHWTLDTGHWTKPSGGEHVGPWWTADLSDAEQVNRPTYHSGFAAHPPYMSILDTRRLPVPLCP